MTHITIPPAALEAGARAIRTFYSDKSVAVCDGVAYKATCAAAIAMLEAWPNKESLNKPSDWHRYVVLCISEKPDDKA